MVQTIDVENIKCGGCMNTIVTALSKMKGVDHVSIDENKETVTYEGSIDRTIIADKLAELGYPEKGQNNLKHKAVSFVSCAVGRLNKA